MTKNALFVTLVAGAKQFEVHRGQFFADFDVFVRLQVAQRPRTPKLAIFVRTTTTTDIQTDCFTTLRMRAG